MYQRILLAFDGTVEGRAALREGALLALRLQARVHLLSVIAPSVGVEIAESVYPGPSERRQADYRAVLDEGLQRLKALGLRVAADLIVGDPAREIGAFARRVRADLVVVGHRRQSLLERWWSGSSGAYLSDHVTCSLLISRNSVSDEQFEAAVAAEATT